MNYVILNKKEFKQMRVGIQQNRNRRKSVFIFILNEFNRARSKTRKPRKSRKKQFNKGITNSANINKQRQTRK